VFLATGVWHGAAWTFVLWGAYHGTFLLIGRVSGLRYIDDAIWQWPRRFATFFIVMLGWVLFRSESLAQAGHFYSALFSFNGAFVSPELALELTGKNLAWVDLALFAPLTPICEQPEPKGRDMMWSADANPRDRHHVL
jgi:alginate O-acetyltransferase complex protein AlgI